jgi:hypothetical protein
MADHQFNEQGLCTNCGGRPDEHSGWTNTKVYPKVICMKKKVLA